MTNTHHAEDLLTEDVYRRATAAMTMTVVRGSTGCTQVEEARQLDGSLTRESTRVERLQLATGRGWKGTCAFQIMDDGSDIILVMPGAPGQYKGHAA